jgi:hypothetical protein
MRENLYKSNYGVVYTILENGTRRVVAKCPDTTTANAIAILLNEKLSSMVKKTDGISNIHEVQA